MKRLLSLSLSCVLFLAGFSSIGFSMVSDDGPGSLETRSTHIVVGRVKAVESSWNEERTMIYTRVTVKVENPLKGAFKDDEVVVRHQGGEVGSVGQWTEHEPSFTKGERVKLFLKKEQDGSYTVVDGEEGKKSLETGQVASSGYHWVGHHWPSASLPVKWYYNLAGGPPASMGALRNAFSIWQSDPCSSMSYDEVSSTTQNTRAKDGYNIIFWGPLDGPGVLPAVCTYYFNTVTLELTEFDIQFDSQDSWQVWAATGNIESYDVENVAAHQLGHSLGLLDLTDPSDFEETMYSSIVKGETTKRTLCTGDLAGLNKIYPATYNLGVGVRTDKITYRQTWPVQVSLRIISKDVSRTVNFYWALYFGGTFLPMLYVPGVTLPKSYDTVIDVDFTVPNLGSTSFRAAWVVAIMDPRTGDILAWSYCQWQYVPGLPSTGPVVTLSDFIAQIANSTGPPY